MATFVVPFRGSDPKRRLAPVAELDRIRLAEAMLADVLAVAAGLGQVFVVAPEQPRLPADVAFVADPRRGQGAAVRAALDAAAAAGAAGPYVVVNADLPCVTPRDLLTLLGALTENGVAVAAAADGTTNALALADASLFEPLYGPGSAARFAALAPSRVVDLPNLADDVDTVDDLVRLGARVGQATRGVVRSLGQGRAA